MCKSWRYQFHLWGSYSKLKGPSVGSFAWSFNFVLDVRAIGLSKSFRLILFDKSVETWMCFWWCVFECVFVNMLPICYCYTVLLLPTDVIPNDSIQIYLKVLFSCQLPSFLNIIKSHLLLRFFQVWYCISWCMDCAICIRIEYI